MNRQKIILITVLVALVGTTAGICNYFKNNRRLGHPGLKLAPVRVFDTKGNVVNEESVPLPEKILDYESQTLPITQEELDWLPADTTYARRAYVAEDKFSILLNVVMMGVDSRSIHKPEICLPGQGWKIESREPAIIRVEHPAPYDLPVMKIIASKEAQLKDGSRQLVRTVYVYWFVAENDLTADHVSRMVKMGVELLKTGTLQRWSYVACMAYGYPGQEEEIYERVKVFIAASVPQFQLADGQVANTK